MLAVAAFRTFPEIIARLIFLQKSTQNKARPSSLIIPFVATRVSPSR
jgi:hypothetical protein